VDVTSEIVGSKVSLTVPGPFDDFYHAEYPRIARLLFGLTGRWALSEELTQESMLEVHRRWDRVRSLDRPDLWLRRVAINKAISARRRLMAEMAAVTRIRGQRVFDTASVAIDQQIWHQIRRLPRRQAAAIVLWAVEDLSHRDIAEALGCTEATARTHVRRAREALQRTLPSEEEQ